MESRKLMFCSDALITALVTAQLLRFAKNVQSQSADSMFCESFAVPYGYNCHQYTTTTTDGFLLAAHRISSKARRTSKSESTTAEAPAPMPPLCVTTAEQPFETIPNFVRESDQPQSSIKTTTDINCFPTSPTSLISGSVKEATPTRTQPQSNAYFVHSSTRQGRIRRSVEDSKPTADSAWVSSSPGSSPSMKATKGHHRFRNPAPGVLPESHPDPQTELDEGEDLNPANPDSQSSPSPSTSGRVSLTESRESVLLMHPEFQNGDSWFRRVDAESDQLLPFLLVNAGFDVWVGHQRATYYAHEHITLTPEDQSYWNWTWDEHAKYDVPALLELVKTEAGSTVHFVGISQSATAGAAAATIFFVSPLLRSLTLIGPTIYRGNTTSRALNAWGELFGSNIGRDTYYYTDYENGAFNLTTDFNSILASLGSASGLLTDVSGPNCCLGSKLKVKFSNGWDGTTSFKNLMHFQQDIRTNTWTKFDYGSVMNNAVVYNGSPLPPIYDPEDIPATLPVLVIYGGQDNIAPPGGARQFVSHLTRSNPSRNSSVFLPEYAHFDLLYSVNRTQDVFIPVLQFLENQRTLQF